MGHYECRRCDQRFDKCECPLPPPYEPPVTQKLGTVMAIDPGPAESAWVLCDGSRLVSFGKYPNANLLNLVRSKPARHLVVEMIASYGMPVGAEVFETCLVIGRIVEAWGSPYTLLKRAEVKMHLCNSMRATDATIRQALIDKYGGKERAIGNKRSPGPLYGVKADAWSALALAVTWSESTKARAA
jgi:hypothetical protein